MSTSNKLEVVVRPVHRDEPDLHKLAEAMMRLVGSMPSWTTSTCGWSATTGSTPTPRRS